MTVEMGSGNPILFWFGTAWRLAVLVQWEYGLPVRGAKYMHRCWTLEARQILSPASVLNLLRLLNAQVSAGGAAIALLAASVVAKKMKSGPDQFFSRLDAMEYSGPACCIAKSV